MVLFSDALSDFVFWNIIRKYKRQMPKEEYKKLNDNPKYFEPYVDVHIPIFDIETNSKVNPNIFDVAKIKENFIKDIEYLESRETVQGHIFQAVFIHSGYLAEYINMLYDDSDKMELESILYNTILNYDRAGMLIAFDYEFKYIDIEINKELYLVTSDNFSEYRFMNTEAIEELDIYQYSFNKGFYKINKPFGIVNLQVHHRRMECKPLVNNIDIKDFKSVIGKNFQLTLQVGNKDNGEHCSEEKLYDTRVDYNMFSTLYSLPNMYLLNSIELSLHSIERSSVWTGLSLTIYNAMHSVLLHRSLLNNEVKPIKKITPSTHFYVMLKIDKRLTSIVDKYEPILEDIIARIRNMLELSNIKIITIFHGSKWKEIKYLKEIPQAELLFGDIYTDDSKITWEGSIDGRAKSIESRQMCNLLYYITDMLSRNSMNEKIKLEYQIDSLAIRKIPEDQSHKYDAFASSKYMLCISNAYELISKVKKYTNNKKLFYI